MKIYEIESDYNPDFSIFNERDATYEKILRLLFNEEIFKEYERRIFFLYLHYGSYRKLQKHTGLNYRRSNIVILEIIKKLKELL